MTGWFFSQTPYQGQHLGQCGHHQLHILIHDVKSQGLADLLDGAPPQLGMGRREIRQTFGIPEFLGLPAPTTLVTEPHPDAVEPSSQVPDWQGLGWGWGERR